MDREHGGSEWARRERRGLDDAGRRPDTLRALVAEVGRVYVPFLLGNAAAIASGAEEVDCMIDGEKWIQPPFPYQAKCLRWIREERAALSAADRADLDSLLSGTGSEALFTDAFPS